MQNNQKQENRTDGRSSSKIDINPNPNIPNFHGQNNPVINV